MAAETYYENVQAVYIAYYGRPADPIGLIYWAERLDVSNGNLDDIISQFANSPEATALYGPIDEFTIEGVINQIYMQAFGRPADEAGLAFYIDGFANGDFTAETIMLDILNGAQNDDLLTLNNKIESAMNFAEAIDPELDGQDLLATYAGADDADQGRAFLESVGKTADTIQSPVNSTEFIQDFIADEGDSIVGNISGEVFTLTTAVDSVEGTAQNDTIHGFLASTSLDTMQAFDVIDGGNGDDTMKIIVNNNTNLGYMGTVTNVENAVFDAFGGGEDATIDMSLVSDVTNLTLNVNVADAGSDFTFENVGLDLETLNVTGNSSANDRSDLSFYMNRNNDTVVGIDQINISEFKGNMDSFEIKNLSTIPELNLTNIGHTSSSSITLEVLDSVATGTDDTLTIVAENAGAFTYNNMQIVNVFLDNQIGDSDIFENLDLTVSGDNSFDINNSIGLETVTLSGTGDTSLNLSNSNTVSTFDASLHSGDLYSSINSALDVTVTLGDGNHFFYLQESNNAAAAVTQTFTSGAGSTWLSLSSDAGDANIVADLGAGDDYVGHWSDNDDTINLGSGDDIFETLWGGGYLDADDTIDGGDGNDTLVLSAADLNADTEAAISNFETLLAGQNGTYDMSNLVGITTVVSGGYDQAAYILDAGNNPDYENDMINITGNSTVAFTNVEADTALTLNISNSTSVSYALATDTTADSVAVELGNTSDNINNNQDVTVASLIVDGIETITIDSVSQLNTADTNKITMLHADAATSITVTGEADTTIGFDVTDAVLSVLDVSGLSADFTMTVASGTANGLQFQGAEGVDTYLGTLNGDTINAGTGQDNITLGTVGNADTVILTDGAALLSATAGDTETYLNFITNEDSIDLGSFGFTGTESSALGSKGDINAQIAAFTSESDDIADFFNVTGIDRGVAISSDGTNTYVLVDANHDGDLNMDTDLVIQLTGTTSVALADFGF